MENTPMNFSEYYNAKDQAEKDKEVIQSEKYLLEAM